MSLRSPTGYVIENDQVRVYTVTGDPGTLSGPGTHPQASWVQSFGTNREAAIKQWISFFPQAPVPRSWTVTRRELYVTHPNTCQMQNLTKGCVPKESVPFRGGLSKEFRSRLNSQLQTANMQYK